MCIIKKKKKKQRVLLKENIYTYKKGSNVYY